MEKCTLVTGGSGLLGRALVALLRARGEPVVIVSRTAPATADDPGVEWRHGDVREPRLGLEEADHRELAARTARVFHLAARTDFTGRDPADYRRTNVIGAEHALEFAAAARAPFHHVSTAFVCGDHRGTFAESSWDVGQQFRNPYERSKYDAEQAVRRRAAELGVEWTIHRPGIILESHPDAASGAGVGPLFYVEALTRLASRTLAEAAGKPTAPIRVRGNAHAGLPLLFDHEAATALLALADLPGIAGKTFHLVPASPVPNRLLETAVNAAFGRTVVRWASEEEWRAAPLTAEERILERKGEFYSPYHDLDVRFDRRHLEESLGRDALPMPAPDELSAAFLAFVESRARAEAPARAAAIAAPEREEVARYFTDWLPRFVGKRMLPNLAGLSAAFAIEVDGAGAWGLEVREGVLLHVRGDERRGDFVYGTEARPFLDVVRGRLAPQETFFRGQTRIEGRKVEALRTATALEEFFRACPFPPADVGAEPPRPTLIPFAEVGARPWPEIVAHARRHLNPGLIELLDLGEFTAVDAQRAEGAAIYDQHGRRIVDFVSSYGALNLGHNHPRVRAALRSVQDDRRVDLSKELLSRYTAVLAHNLAQLTPGDLDSVTFCNSGAEAIEAALKLAQRWHGGRRRRFVYAEGSMHGKTIGALSVTGGDHYRDVFRVPEQTRVPYGDLDAIERALKGAPAEGEAAIAGVVLEPIQGEAGVIVPPAGYLAGARRLCDRYGALLILDEVQTGFGRTGTFFGCRHEGVVPDILAVAKSLGGGMATIGAAIARTPIYRKAYGNPHDCLIQTSTFGGRASACAAGIATLETLVEERLPERAARLGDLLLGRLRELAARRADWIADVRGRGLMIGIEFQPDLLQRMGSLSLKIPGLSQVIRRHVPGMVAAAMLKRHGFLCSLMLNNRSVLRVYPPLVVEEEDLLRFVAGLEEVFDEGFDALVKGRIKHALSSAGLRFLAPWIAAWKGR